MKEDINSREDLDRLVRHFYDFLLADERMEPIFTSVAKIDLESHFPHLVEFWHSLIFMTGAYKRNVMDKHLSLHLKYPLQEEHFQIWLNYFYRAVDDLFSGPRSEDAKSRAKSMALLMQVKIRQMDQGSLLL